MEPNLKSIVVCFIAAPLAAIGLFTATDATGQEPKPKNESSSRFADENSRGRGGLMRGHPLIGLLDLDEDGVLSTSEIRAASTQLLAFDQNRDGRLEESELHAAMPQPSPPRRGGGMGARPAERELDRARGEGRN